MPIDSETFFTMENSMLRDEIHRVAARDDRLACLFQVAVLHGHICPGIALGIMATLAGLRELGVIDVMNDGMEDMLAIVETNACFADAVQYVSGCTLGNNALIYRDYGKTAVTFALRSRPQAVRVRVLPEFAGIINQGAPRFFPLMDTVVRHRSGTPEDERAFMRAGREAALHILQQDIARFLAISRVEPDLPPYAPITDTLICPDCGEPFMAAKGVSGGKDRTVCRACAGQACQQVEGLGIVARSPASARGSS